MANFLDHFEKVERTTLLKNGAVYPRILGFKFEFRTKFEFWLNVEDFFYDHGFLHHLEKHQEQQNIPWVSTCNTKSSTEWNRAHSKCSTELQGKVW